jgi:hypothetical protein
MGFDTGMATGRKRKSEENEKKLHRRKRKGVYA